MTRIPFDLELYRNQMRAYISGRPYEQVFWDALDFATEAHDDQWRRSGDAYILHPCSVAKILAEEMDNTPQANQASGERLALIMKETRRLEEVLDNFLRYARRRPLALAPLSINDLISDVLTFLKPETRRSRIELETRFDATNPEIQGDQSLIKQALLNVVLNAVEAMPEGGRLEVATEPHATGVRVTVTDTGAGIDAEDLPKVYDAYFSTRRGGTGLGLAITRRIIEGHGGTISVESAPGRGTTVTIFLPSEGPSGDA